MPRGGAAKNRRAVAPGKKKDPMAKGTANLTKETNKKPFAGSSTNLLRGKGEGKGGGGTRNFPKYTAGGGMQ